MMSLLPSALCAFAIALLLGEGAAWAALALMALGLWRHIPRVSWPVGWRPSWAARSLMVYAAAGMLAWILGGYGLLRAGALGHVLPVFAWPLTAWAVRRCSLRDSYRAIGCFLGATLAACALSLMTRHGHGVSAENWVRLDTWAAEQNYEPGSRMQVMGGLYYHRLKMAHVLLVALGPQVARHLVLPMRPARRAAEAMALAACMAALGLTYARAAYLGAAGGACACAMGLAFYRPSLRRRLVAWVVVIGLSVCVALAMSPAVRQRLLSVRGQEAAKVRQVIWTQAIAMTHAHPWGVGLGNYPQVVGPYYHLADPFDPSPITYPHSMVWMAWAEAGPVGLIAWLFFWLSTLTDAVRGLAAAQATRTQQVAAGAWLFIGTALGLVGLTHDVLFHNIVALTFFAALGCTRVLMRENIR